ncbi:DhaL domain [Trinorchestia longiramus]|nr:DhaL domain [Trinorchestia longiramus]
MEAKKQTLILNSPDDCVNEMLAGLCSAHPALCKLPDSAVVVDSRWVGRPGAGRGRRCVAIVTGGGSGHEPFAAAVTDINNLTAVTDINNLTAVTDINNLTAVTDINNLTAGTDINNLTAGTDIINLTAGTDINNLTAVTDINNLTAGTDINNLTAGTAVTGYVGHGMVTAAVAGSVFASPPAGAVERAVRAVADDAGKTVQVGRCRWDGAGTTVQVGWCRWDGAGTTVQVGWCRWDGAGGTVQVGWCRYDSAGGMVQVGWCRWDGAEGVLVVAYNYTGDRINFAQAVERCKDMETKVEMAILGDDSAMKTLGGNAGRRGLCGGVLLLKILGAQAERGSSLAELLVTCRDVSGQLSTCGVAAGGCTVPGACDPLFTVPPGKLELGLGVHGEAGAKSLTKSSARDVVTAIMDLMLDPSSDTSLSLSQGDHVVALVNNLGSMSHMEILVIANEVSTTLEKKGIVLERLYIGPFMTSLDMRGFHITLLRITDHPHWVELLDDPTDAPVWQPSSRKPDGLDQKNIFEKLSVSPKKRGSNFELSDDAAATVRAILRDVASTAPDWTDQLNQLDSGCGDGDCGSTIASGAQSLLLELDHLPVSRPVQLLDHLAHQLGVSMGGTSGEACACGLCGMWYVHVLCDTRGLTIKPLDALCPAIAAAKNLPNYDDLETVLCALSIAADAGAKATKDMRAKAGRASYVRGGDSGKEDAGARAVALLLDCMARTSACISAACVSAACVSAACISAACISAACVSAAYVSVACISAAYVSAA